MKLFGNCLGNCLKRLEDFGIIFEKRFQKLFETCLKRLGNSSKTLLMVEKLVWELLEIVRPQFSKLFDYFSLPGNCVNLARGTSQGGGGTRKSGATAPTVKNLERTPLGPYGELHWGQMLSEKSETKNWKSINKMWETV